MRLGDLVPALQAYGRTCWRKERHASEGAARAHLRGLEKRGRVRDPETLNVYQCRCGYWHVGHTTQPEMEIR